MLRNKEFKRLILVSVVVLVAELIILLNIDKIFKVVLIVLAISIMALYMSYVIHFTIARYRKIENMSKWLAKLQGQDTDNIASYIEDLKGMAGHDEFKLENYIEGELSILQSDIHKVTVRMIELNESLLKDKTYLADTLADISHQLKTPMTSMMVMSDLLSAGDLPADKRAEFTKNIQNQLGRMEWLLTTLLRMSKLDAGTLKLNLEMTDMSKIIKRSVEHLLIPIELKNQNLVIKRDGVYDKSDKNDSELLIKVDENWTVEALSNIVKNCMEHTPVNGQITISYGRNPLYEYITIADNGAGIASEDLPHVFKRFYKGKNAGKDSVGIGLAFAKQIINMENGSIEVTSKTGEGSKFVIKFYRGTV